MAPHTEPASHARDDGGGFVQERLVALCESWPRVASDCRDAGSRRSWLPHVHRPGRHACNIAGVARSVGRPLLVSNEERAIDTVASRPPHKTKGLVALPEWTRSRMGSARADPIEEWRTLSLLLAPEALGDELPCDEVPCRRAPVASDAERNGDSTRHPRRREPALLVAVRGRPRVGGARGESHVEALGMSYLWAREGVEEAKEAERTASAVRHKPAPTRRTIRPTDDPAAAPWRGLARRPTVPMTAWSKRPEGILRRSPKRSCYAGGSDRVGSLRRECVSMSSTVHLLCGKTGSGKTTFARHLEQERRALAVSVDPRDDPALRPTHAASGLRRTHARVH